VTPKAKTRLLEPSWIRALGLRFSTRFRAFATARVVVSGGASESLLAPSVARSCSTWRPGLLARLALAFVSSAVAVAFAAAPAAAEPPRFQTHCEVEAIHATRAFAEEGQVSGNGSQIDGSRIEYSTGETGPFTLAFDEPHSQSGNSGVELTHLSPATTYYVLFVAESNEGPATEIVKFTTHAAEAPEVGELKVSETNGTSEEGPSYVAFHAVGSLGRSTPPGGVESNGSATEYSFEYALPESGHAPAQNSPSWAPFTSDAGGTVSVAEDFASPRAELSGLTPETTYYVRLTARNAAGAAEQVTSFETTPISPQAGVVSPFDVGASSASVKDSFIGRGFETGWRFEYTTEPGNPVSWTPVPGGSGTVAALAPSELFLSNEYEFATATITGLSPETAYYVRAVINNGHGETNLHAGLFTTLGKPSATAFATHTLDGETVRVLGSVNPDTTPLDELQTVTLDGGATGGAFTLAFEGETTTPIAFNASGETVLRALETLKKLSGNVDVSGNAGGPYTVDFNGPLGGSSQPQLTADASGLTPSGTVAVAVNQSGLSYDTRYHVQYVSQRGFEEDGFADPEVKDAPEVDLGAGEEQGDGAGAVTRVVGEDLPGLQAGETYHFRVVASNTTSGDPVVESAEQTVTAPVRAPAEAGSVCPNEDLRSGPSAKLLDCRAYEQVTPVEKQGAQDVYRYGGGITEGNLVGEDGDHFLLHAPGVKWGASADPVEGNYFFSRTEDGWQTTSAKPAGAGPDSYEPTVLGPDLTQVGVEARWATTEVTHASEIALEAGAPGGPYTTVASIPSKQVSQWVAASADGSRLVLQSEDHSLLGSPTGTKSGMDLYEYSEGALRQVNVSGAATIGSCGAEVVNGFEGYEGGHSDQGLSSDHAISADGSRVFFEAVPGAACGAAKNLYMRVGGAETLDIGEYSFVAANPEGNELLLEHKAAGTYELFLYNTETASAKHLLTTGEQIAGIRGVNLFVVSENLDDFYFFSEEQLTPGAPPINRLERHPPTNLYRYDIPEERLDFVAQSGSNGNPGSRTGSVSPDGRYFYWEAYYVVAVPGGGIESGEETSGGKVASEFPAQQVYRYDSVEDLLQCMSCASPFDPEPKLGALFLDTGTISSSDGAPDQMTASANGDYVFFDTPAALVPQDVDGELAPEHDNDKFGTPGYGGYVSSSYSPSSDVYEWRKNGVDGCGHVQGCLSLITSGKGGLKNMLLGTDASGRDVFFTTHESLVPTDQDTAADVYDARIGGGFPPPPPRPVECEGDSCSTPFAAPNDLTPSSASFHGTGDVTAEVLPQTKSKPKTKKTKPKKKGKRRKRSKAGARGRGRKASAIGSVHRRHGGAK
jgi:hypothetical protein